MIPGIKKARRVYPVAAAMRPLAVVLFLAVASGSLAMACGSDPTLSPTPSPTPIPRVQVVTTIAILADFVRNVGGDKVDVKSIVPPGTDIHSFQSRPGDSIAISNARFIVSNGMGLDRFLDSLLSSAKRSDSVHVVASEGLEAAPMKVMEFAAEDHETEHGEEGEGHAEAEDRETGHGEEGEGHAEAEDHETEHGEEGEGHAEAEDHETEHGEEGEGHAEAEDHETEHGEEGEGHAEAEDHETEHGEEEGGHEHTEGDPHLWQDPSYAIHYVERLRDGLIGIDPANGETYRANAEAYIGKLRELDREIVETLSVVPPQNRHLVTFHDAFGYFARRYGWRFSAFVPSDASDVTPGAVVAVMERVQEEGIPAVFAEPQFNSDVMEQAARDAGVRVGAIYSDVLNESAPTYIDMMEFNAKSLATWLQR